MSFGRGGGGRGGRGGIGGGGGGGGAGMGMTRSGAQIPMGTMTWADLAEVDKKKPSKSYPVMEERPILSPPSRMETRIIQNQLHLLQNQKETPWWPTEEDKNRKRDGVIRYSDQFQKDSIENNRSGLSLKDDDLINTLQKEAFPAGLWNLYMTAESKRQEKEKKREEQKRGADWHRVIETFEQNGSGDHHSDRASSQDEDEGQRDEYEDDEEDDYADNYFDNGEDDDIQEEGGEGAEETYE